MDTRNGLYKNALEKAFQLGNEFLDELDHNPVETKYAYEQLKSLWDWNLPVEGQDPAEVITDLSKSARPGLNLNQSGRFFSWVIGGSHPSAIAADWLTSAWDQNAGLYAGTPSSGIVEEIAGSWLKQLLHIPAKASFAFVTGGQMANTTCLNVARNHLFQQAGWDFEANGFYGAPHIRIICGDLKHNTVIRSLRMLGFGRTSIIDLPTNENGTIQVDAVKKEFERDAVSPTLLVLQAGEIHTGSFDDFHSIIPIAHKHKAWVHIDGAFGLWASASPAYAHHMQGAEHADSWATDGHKWLNVPYDCGYAFIAHPESHYKTFTNSADYLVESNKARDQFNWTPELSRRARGYATYAVIRELGAKGIEALVDRLCKHASSIVTGAATFPQVKVLAYPVINQGLLRFPHPTKPDIDELNDKFTEDIIATVNASGEAFFQPSTYKGKRCMRVSVSGWRTSDEDVRRTIAAIGEAIQMVSNKKLL